MKTYATVQPHSKISESIIQAYSRNCFMSRSDVIASIQRGSEMYALHNVRNIIQIGCTNQGLVAFENFLEDYFGVFQHVMIGTDEVTNTVVVDFVTVTQSGSKMGRRFCISIPRNSLKKVSRIQWYKFSAVDAVSGFTNLTLLREEFL